MASALKSASALSMSVVPNAWASVGALREFPIKTAIAKCVACELSSAVLSADSTSVHFL